MPRQTIVQSSLSERRLARQARLRPWAQPQAQTPAADGLDRSCSDLTETGPRVSKIPRLVKSHKFAEAKSQAASPAAAAADGSDRSCSKLPRPATDRLDGSCKTPTEAKSQASSPPATDGSDRSRSAIRGILMRREPLDIVEAKPQASDAASGIPIRRELRKTRDLGVYNFEGDARLKEVERINDAWFKAHTPAVGGPDRNCDNISCCWWPQRHSTFLANHAAEHASDCSTSGSTTPSEETSLPAKLKTVSWNRAQYIKPVRWRYPSNFWDGWAPKGGWPDDDDEDEEE
ncbi:MAG: hypothetical protein Q9187_004965 [Circinaria calcarea]